MPQQTRPIQNCALNAVASMSPALLASYSVARLKQKLAAISKTCISCLICLEIFKKYRSANKSEETSLADSASNNSQIQQKHMKINKKKIFQVFVFSMVNYLKTGEITYFMAIKLINKTLPLERGHWCVYWFAISIPPLKRKFDDSFTV